MYQLHVAQAVVTLNKPQFAKTLIQCILVNTTSSMEPNLLRFEVSSLDC